MNSQHLHSDVVIPGGALALQAQAGLDRVGGVGADQVEDDLLQQREVLRRVVLAHHAGILAEAHVQHPVQPVLNAPVRAHRAGQLLGREHARADVVALLDLGGRVADKALRDDAADGLAAGPQRGVDRVAAGRGPAQLQDGSTVAALDVLEAGAGRLRIAEQIAHLLRERRLVALDREQVVGALVADLGSDLALTAHRIDAHQQPLEIERVEQLGDGGDFIAFAGDLLLAQHQAEIGREGARHMHRRPVAIGRAAQGLAVDGHREKNRGRTTISQFLKTASLILLRASFAAGRVSRAALAGPRPAQSAPQSRHLPGRNCHLSPGGSHPPRPALVRGGTTPGKLPAGTLRQRPAPGTADAASPVRSLPLEH